MLHSGCPTIIHHSILHPNVIKEAKQLTRPVCWEAKIGLIDHTQISVYGVQVSMWCQQGGCSGGLYEEQSVPAMKPLQGTAEPSRKDSGTSGKTYLRNGKHCRAVRSAELWMWAAERHWKWRTKDETRKMQEQQHCFNLLCLFLTAQI